MKNFILLFSVIVLSTTAISQTDLDNRFYFRGGFSTPSWTYYGADGKDDFSDTLGNFANRLGGIFEMGSIFIINDLDITKGLRLGVNVDYLSASYSRFKWDQLEELEQLHNLYIGSKIGPSLTYTPVKGLLFDAFIKINPIWVAACVYENKDFETPDDAYLGYVQMIYNFGINIRYSLLIVGFEYNIGSIKLKNDDASGGTYLGNLNDDKDKTSVPHYNFTIGINF